MEDHTAEIDEKACRVCGITKPLAEFPKRSSYSDGHRTECKECLRAYLRGWHSRNREHVRAYQQKYRLAHPEKIKKYQAAYRAKPGVREQKNEYRRRWKEINPDRYREQNQEYYRKNKDRLAALNRANKEKRRTEDPEGWAFANRSYIHRYKARRRAATIEKVDYKSILAAHGMVCHICGGEILKRRGTDPDSLVFDHVIPLSRGGPHSEANLRPAHFYCNGSKHDKLMSEVGS